MSTEPNHATRTNKPSLGRTVSVAPMMAWTDRHCRFLHRLYSPSALLFTEMVTTGALIRGARWHKLEHNEAEQPLVLQLGGNNPRDLAECTARAADLGFVEINLNVGCPSDRVQRGTFGACLMRQPQLVADCVQAMDSRGDIEVSVKCRLGVDDHDSDELLLDFIDTVAAGGCRRFYIHARKAILAGLSPAQNRSIPPLQPARVRWLKSQRPELEIVINGGISSTADVMDHLQWADGVMIGRAAYQHPELLAQLERLLFNDAFAPTMRDIMDAYRSYIATQLAAGEQLHNMTRHLLHTCNGLPGARRFRQVLSDSRRLQSNDLNILEDALSQLRAA